MSFRFFRRLHRAPSISLAMSKGGTTLTIGPRGAGFSSGNTASRVTAGIPGEGMYYYTPLDKEAERKNKERGVISGWTKKVQESTRFVDIAIKERANPSEGEPDFVRALKYLVHHQPQAAFQAFREGNEIPDSAALAGLLALNADRPEVAVENLKSALTNHALLNYHLQSYGLDVKVGIWITDLVMVGVEVNKAGLLLGLAEAYQMMGKLDESITVMHDLGVLLGYYPDILKLSLAELLLEDDSEDSYREIIRLAPSETNANLIHSALLWYKAKSLDKLGMFNEAWDMYTLAMRKRRNRPQALMLSIQYDRALMLEKSGQKGRARREFMKIYRRDPDFENVLEFLEN